MRSVSGLVLSKAAYRRKRLQGGGGIQHCRLRLEGLLGDCGTCANHTPSRIHSSCDLGCPVNIND